MLCHRQVPVKCRPTEARCSTCGRRPLVAAARGFCSWDTLFWSHGRSPSPLPCRPPGAPAWPLGTGGDRAGLVQGTRCRAGVRGLFGGREGQRDGVGPGSETGLHCVPVTGPLGLPPQPCPPVLGPASLLASRLRRGRSALLTATSVSLTLRRPSPHPAWGGLTPPCLASNVCPLEALRAPHTPCSHL